MNWCMRLPATLSVALVLPVALAVSPDTIASERRCAYTDDPAVYECGYDEPLRSQTEMEGEMAERRAAREQAAHARELMLEGLREQRR